MTPLRMATSAAANHDDSREARAEIRQVCAAALSAVDGTAVVERALCGDPPPALTGATRIHLIAVGKAARSMARGAMCALGNRSETTVEVGPIVTPGRSAPLGPHPVYRGGHPVPDQDSVAAAVAVRARLAAVDAGDAVLMLLSGGASASLEEPIPGIELSTLQRVTGHLLAAGADIHALNLVRRGLSKVKGGGLLDRLPTRRVVTLAISDVIGDDPEVIGSGPTVPCASRGAAVIRVLRDFHTPPALLDTISAALEARAPTPVRSGGEYRVVATASDAVEAAAGTARQLGYETTVRTGVTGEARDLGSTLARDVADADGAPRCWLSSGEPTVTVRGNGRGGRSLEVALGAALELAGSRGKYVAALGTDGIDGTSPAAGAIADGGTLQRAERRGLDAAGYLAANDSYTFFAGLGDLLTTGPTGTNVMDIQVALSTGNA